MQTWTSQNRCDNFIVNSRKQGHANGILAATQKPFGSINRINGPIILAIIAFVVKQLQVI